MQKVKIENERFLEVDFRGLLSPREETIIAYRIAGKSQAEISEELGISQETAKTQASEAFVKTEVKGKPNPLQLLTLLSFEKGFVKFAAWALMIVNIQTTSNSANNLNAVRTRPAQTRRTSRRESGFSLAETFYSISNNTTLEGTLS